MSDFMVISFVFWPDISSIVASMPNLRFTILVGVADGWLEDVRIMQTQPSWV